MEKDASLLKFTNCIEINHLMKIFYETISSAFPLFTVAKNTILGAALKIEKPFPGGAGDQFMRDFHSSDLLLLTKKSMNYVSNVFGNRKTNRLFAQQSVGAFCHAHSEFLIYNKCLRNILCVKIYLQLKLRKSLLNLLIIISISL